MTNDHGLRVRFLSLGDIITEIDAPDCTERLDNIALGLRSLWEYETFPGQDRYTPVGADDDRRRG
jgi:hypothetical protein